MTTGLYRRRKAGKNGKLRDAGAYVIDMRIKRVPELAGIKQRLFKTTGVFPGHRNASTIVAEMKLMIKELIRERDIVTLRKIQSNVLSLPSAYKQWKTGRIHLAEGQEDKRVVKLWRSYIEHAPLAESTKTNRLAIVSALEAKDFLTAQTVVNELPELLKKIRRHYEGKKQAPAFNTIRIEVGAFLTKGLNMEPDSRFVRDTLRATPLPVRSRREHHPFYSPHDCEAFCADLLLRKTALNRVYVESVLFMCLHGLRPEEFAEKRFAVDPKTEHLRIAGTKNPNAARVVPLLWEYPSNTTPKIDTLNRLFERMKSPVRCRDFRRTYSIWCELAGLPSSRVRAYMGHAPETVTQTYQSTVPKQTTLDLDRATLVKWYQDELAKERQPRKRGAPATAYGVLMHMLGPSLGYERWSIAAESSEDKPPQKSRVRKS
ncbi:MAG: hypothetical protein C0497_12245 [Gemmatimonas sp.]|nr:hypothetical protein [Gemmatimonas sp.]